MKLMAERRLGKPDGKVIFRSSSSEEFKAVFYESANYKWRFEVIT
jgi:hypothetical protein